MMTCGYISVSPDFIPKCPRKISETLTGVTHTQLNESSPIQRF
jgi:hypothetical protein